MSRELSQYPQDGNAASSLAQKGSTMVEFSLVANLILLLFSGIVDFSLVVTRYNIVSQALQRSARAVQVEVNQCENRATDVFIAAVQSYGLPVEIDSFVATVAGGAVTLTVDAEMPCLVCRAIFLQDIRYQQSLVVPLEEANGCPDTF